MSLRFSGAEELKTYPNEENRHIKSKAQASEEKKHDQDLEKYVHPDFAEKLENDDIKRHYQSDG